MLRTTLTLLFGCSIVVANITAAKLAFIPIPILGETPVPAGFIAFGVAFLASDLLTEYYGEDYAASVVNATVITLVVAYVLVWVAIALPTAPFYDGQAYQSVLGGSAAVVAASVVTLALSQRFDVWLFARLKAATDGQHRWLRNCASTFSSQVIDTVVFITLAFAVFPALQGGDVLWGTALVTTIVGQYIAKLAVAALDTPLFYAITEVVDR
jgi:uncharacterized integral membrane protein (TIGR00697 family)